MHGTTSVYNFIIDIINKVQIKYTGWPKKNATTLVRNFNDILD